MYKEILVRSILVFVGLVSAESIFSKLKLDDKIKYTHRTTDISEIRIF